MFYNGFNKTGSRKKTPEIALQWLCYFYKKEDKSIIEIAKEYGYSKVVVNRACKNISQNKKNSRNGAGKVYQINLLNGNIIREFENAHQASVLLNLNYSSLIQCLNGRTNNCGGFGWSLKNKYHTYKRPEVFQIRIYSSEKIDKLLGL